MRRRTLPLAVLALVLLVPVLASADNCEFAAYQQRGWFWMFLGSFGFGFLTSLTPCVYPMIPITLAIFGARGGDVSRKRAIMLAASYVGGMCLTYAVLGVTVAMIGKAADFGSQLGSPYFVIPLACLFVALAASMFGAFDLNLPSSWQAKLNTVGGKGFGGAFAMGLVGGLIAAPCSGPFLTGLLSFVATTGNASGGGALLFVYGIGMGVLFFVLAAFAIGLPKSGRWMDAVKSLGGIALLAAAGYYVLPLFPKLAHLIKPTIGVLVVVIAIAAVGIAIGAVQLSFHGTWPERIRKGVGVALVVVGALGLIEWKLAPRTLLPYEHDEAVAFDHARTAHKGVMVDFSAEWCVPCHEMEVTFGDSEVYAQITESFVPLKFDVTSSNDANDAIRQKYGAATLPAVVFIDTDGNVLQRIKKPTERDEMLAIVTQAASHTPLAANSPCAR